MESLHKTLAMELKEFGAATAPTASQTFEISSDFFDESLRYSSINRPRLKLTYC
jgi:hypothetical protein